MNSFEKSSSNRVDDYTSASRLLPTLDAAGMNVLRHIYSSAVDPAALATLQNEMLKAIPHPTVPSEAKMPTGSPERIMSHLGSSSAFTDVKRKLSQYHQMFFMDGIRDLHNQGFGVDVTFILDDGRVGANCSVMVCASPFLKSLLDDSKEHIIVSVPGIRLKTMKDLLGFLYTGCLQHNTNISDLLEAVHVLGMKELIAIMLKSNPPVEPMQMGSKPDGIEHTPKRTKKRKRNTPEPHHDADYKSREVKPCILGELLTKPGHSSSHIYSSERSNTPLNLTKSKINSVQSNPCSRSETKQTDFQLGLGSIPVQYPGVMEAMPTGYNHLLDAFGSYSQLASSVGASSTCPTMTPTKTKSKKDSSKNSPKKSSHGTILENHLLSGAKSSMTPDMLKDIYERLGISKSLAEWPTLGSLPPLLHVGSGLNLFPNIFSSPKLGSMNDAEESAVSSTKEESAERSILNLSASKPRSSDSKSELPTVPSLKIGNTDLVAPPEKEVPGCASPKVENEKSDLPVNMVTDDAKQADSGTQTTEASAVVLQNSMLMSSPHLLTKFGFDGRNPGLVPTSFPLGTLGISLSSPSSLANTGGLIRLPLPETSPDDPGPVDLSSISSRSRVSSWNAASKPSDSSRDIDVVGSPGPSENRADDDTKVIPDQFLASRLQQTFNLESSHPATLLHPDIRFPKQKDSGPATPDSIEVLEETINTEKPPTPFMHPTSNGNNMGRRRKGCGDCTGCQEVHDCGQCRFCKDKGKFGGPNRLKQVCMNKKCVATEGETDEGRRKKKKIRKKIARCGNCKPCQTNQDCGDCESCLSNANAQPTTRKKTCELRVCVEQEMDAFLEKGNVVDEPSPYSTDSLRGASLILGGIHAKLFQPLLNIPGQKAYPKKIKKSDANQKNNPSKARTKYYCGQCSGCMRASPCGNCQYCEDMPKFGGPGRFRQKCMKQLCDHHPRLQTLKASNRSKLTGDVLADSLQGVDSKDSFSDLRTPIKSEDSTKEELLTHSSRGVPNLISIVRPEQLMDSVNFNPHYQNLGLLKEDTHDSDSEIDVDQMDSHNSMDFTLNHLKSEKPVSPQGDVDHSSGSPQEPIGKLHIKKCENKGPTSKWQIKMSPTHSDKETEQPSLPLEGNNNESMCTTMSCDAVVEQMKPLPIKKTSLESGITRGPSICPGLEIQPKDTPRIKSSMKIGMSSPSSDPDMDDTRTVDQTDSSADPAGDEHSRRGRGRSKKRGRRSSQSPGAEGSNKKTKRGRKKKKPRFTVDSDEYSDYDEYYFPVPTERDLNKQAAELSKQKSAKITSDCTQKDNCEQLSGEKAAECQTIDSDKANQLVQTSALDFEKKSPIYSSSVVVPPGIESHESDQPTDPAPSP